MQSLKLDYIGLTILTPFPGTEYYEEVKHLLLTKNYDYYDLIHTVLPTKLPVKKFYKEYIRLVNKSIAPKRKFFILEKYRLRELLPAIAIWMKWMKRIKKIHFDYDKNLLSGKIGNDK